MLLFSALKAPACQGVSEMSKLAFIAIGGATGALLRYYVSGLTYRYLDGLFPWGTLVVNMTGCLFIGFLWQIFETIADSADIRAFIFVGVLGAFTTFSTFGLETMNLIKEGDYKYAVNNIVVSNVLGIVLVFAGFVLGRYLINLMRTGV